MVDESRRIESLDWLRALAIILVLIHHIGRGVLKGFLPSFLGESWTGVDLFFVLSGYLVTRSFADWLNEIGPDANLKDRSRIALRYALRRFLRILPPAWLWAAIPLIASIGFNKSGDFGTPDDLRREFLGVISFFYNYFTVHTGLAKINYFWSLAVEEHFYLVLPFFLVLARGLSKRLIGLAVLAGVCAMWKIAAVAQGESPSAIRFLSHFRADALAIGAILGILDQHIRRRASIWGSRLRSSRFSAVLAFGCVLYLWVAPSVLTVAQVGMFGLFSFSLTSATLVILALRAPLRSESRIGSWIASIGRRSYSLYLVHLPVYHAVREIRFRATGMPSREPWSHLHFALAELAICICLLWVVNEISYRWVERPLIRWGRLWFPRPNRSEQLV